jgi:hypothetical protein
LNKNNTLQLEREDDLVILCRRGSAETALHHLREIMGKLKLAVNEEKTRDNFLIDQSASHIKSIANDDRGPSIIIVPIGEIFVSQCVNVFNFIANLT